MYGFDQQVDWSNWLERREIVRVSFLAYQVDLLLTPDVCVTLRGNFLFRNGTDEIGGSGQRIDSCTGLIALVGDTVQTARMLEPERLSLAMASGRMLELIDDSARYEAFEFQRPDAYVIV